MGRFVLVFAEQSLDCLTDLLEPQPPTRANGMEWLSYTPTTQPGA